MRFEALLGRVGAPGQPHRWHVHAFDALTPLMNACRGTGDPAGSLTHAIAVVAAIEGVQGSLPSVELGNYLELIGQVGMSLSWLLMLMSSYYGRDAQPNSLSGDTRPLLKVSLDIYVAVSPGQSWRSCMRSERRAAAWQRLSGYGRESMPWRLTSELSRSAPFAWAGSTH